ncbi:PAS domain S-box protein [Candidatus Villigracilis affinis]|uniref:PAS domain-containing protein n=1 Tax=Candidatus Villigracilis affinis TaxID=3140682 RepID=UPI001DE2AFA5|nr:PAS domain S-box protein [Anaerolineales bacterium]
MESKNQTFTQDNFSEELLQTVYLQAGDGIFLVDDQKIIAANPYGCDMFGYSSDEIIGLPLMEQVPEDEITHITEKLALLAITKFVISETSFYRKDGSRMEVEISGKILSNGQILGICGTSQRKAAKRPRKRKTNSGKRVGFSGRERWRGNRQWANPRLYQYASGGDPRSEQQG